MEEFYANGKNEEKAHCSWLQGVFGASEWVRGRVEVSTCS